MGGGGVVRTFFADEKVDRFYVQMYEPRRVTVPQRPPDILLNLPHGSLRYLPPGRRLHSVRTSNAKGRTVGFPFIGGKWKGGSVGDRSGREKSNN